MSNFRWGILGTGGIAQAFALDLAYLDGHSVAAVGSRIIDSAKGFAEKFPGCTPYGSYEELVQEDADARNVQSPHPMHSRARDACHACWQAGPVRESLHHQ